MANSLEAAAEQVRRLKAEVISAEVSEKFHLDMAASARSELLKHQRNLDQAEKVLVKEAQKTPGAPVPGPRKPVINPASMKVS